MLYLYYILTTSVSLIKYIMLEINYIFALF